MSLEAEVEALRQEVAALRAELAELRARPLDEARVVEIVARSLEGALAASGSPSGDADG